MSDASEASVAAIDLGATSGRVVVGGVDDGVLRMREVARFDNTPVRVADGLHWSALSLYSAAMTGLGRASREEQALVGAAVDSWAVDYALLRSAPARSSGDGPTRVDRMLGEPFHYRDDRGERAVPSVHSIVSAEELYRRNGLQHLPFTTLFQLVASASAGDLGLAERALLIPDLVGYWATGRAVTERTNASTTGLLGVDDGDWDGELMAALGIPRTLLTPLVDPGESLGPVIAETAEAFGIVRPVEFTAVGSHDTASAVVGVPMAADDEAVYISCGTWSLVGMELERPVVSEAARIAGFTNEGGVDGRIRFLKNVSGLWLLAESMRAWERRGEPQRLEALLAAAEALPGAPLFDTADPRLTAPGDLPALIAGLIVEAGGPPPSSPAETVRSVLESLAAAYAEAARDLERLTGRTPRRIHLVGGGARNALLCRLTADRTGLPVEAGPVEATAIGNLVVQARTHGMLAGDLEALRSVVRRSFPTVGYDPRLRARRSASERG